MFQVKGDQAQWRTVYDHIRQMSIGDRISYDELAALLPDAAEGSIRGALYRAVQECETQDRRTFANVRGYGYRMVDAPENAVLARGYQKRANRGLKKAKRKVATADRTRLTREDRARFEAMELALGRQIEMTRRLEQRVERIDADLKSARRKQSSDTAGLSERVDRLAELLEKHGIGAQLAA